MLMTSSDEKRKPENFDRLESAIDYQDFAQVLQICYETLLISYSELHRLINWENREADGTTYWTPLGFAIDVLNQENISYSKDSLKKQQASSQVPEVIAGLLLNLGAHPTLYYHFANGPVACTLEAQKVQHYLQVYRTFLLNILTQNDSDDLRHNVTQQLQEKMYYLDGKCHLEQENESPIPIGIFVPLIIWPHEFSEENILYYCRQSPYGSALAEHTKMTREYKIKELGEILITKPQEKNLYDFTYWILFSLQKEKKLPTLKFRGKINKKYFEVALDYFDSLKKDSTTQKFYYHWVDILRREIPRFNDHELTSHPALERFLSPEKPALSYDEIVKLFDEPIISEKKTKKKKPKKAESSQPHTPKPDEAKTNAAESCPMIVSASETTVPMKEVLTGIPEAINKITQKTSGKKGKDKKSLAYVSSTPGIGSPNPAIDSAILIQSAELKDTKDDAKISSATVSAKISTKRSTKREKTRQPQFLPTAAQKSVQKTINIATVLEYHDLQNFLQACITADSLLKMCQAFYKLAKTMALSNNTQN